MTSISQTLVAPLVVIYFSNIFLYLYQIKATTFSPLNFYVLTLGVVLMAVIWRSSKYAFQVPVHFLIWLVSALVYFIFTYFLSSQSETAYQILIYYAESLALLVAFLLLFQLEGAAELVRKLVVVIMLASVALNVYDFFIPTFSTTAGRSAGLYINPNYSGFMLALGMVVGVTALPNKLRFLFCLIVGVGILVTFSRSSWMLWGISIAGLVMCRQLTLNNRAIGFVLALISVLIVYSLYSGGMLEILVKAGFSKYLNPDVIARLGGGESFTDDSAASRLDAAYSALLVFSDHPWIGAGLAFTREWDVAVAPHNMFLTMAAEGGVIGFIMLAWFYYMIWRLGDDVGKLIVILLVFFSLFSHNVLEKPAIMLVVALIICPRETVEKIPTSSLALSVQDDR